MRGQHFLSSTTFFFLPPSQNVYVFAVVAVGISDHEVTLRMEGSKKNCTEQFKQARKTLSRLLQ